MSEIVTKMVDGNEAAASVAYRTNEICAIYPITPSSPMGEFADTWAAEGRPNIWGTIPEVVEMQSEAGAAGTVHGSLQAGALTTTFTASQGLLLMIPNLYKIAGELTPCCIHVAARTLATHALSIFGDHSDVMATRQIGLALLASGSVQEAHDMALIGQSATLSTRIPFMHFFDGFRTSHEVSKVEVLGDDVLREMIDNSLVRAHRDRALTPDHPVVRGTAQNPDTFFQAREACNTFYLDCPEHVQTAMDRFAELTGRRYRLFDYVGHPEAERVIILMGSGAEAADQTVEWMAERGERVGVVKVRLYRPFSTEALLEALPPTVRSIAVLDRTKEPGAVGEPLYLDVVAALRQVEDRGELPWESAPRVVGGRYGLSSKEFTPAAVKRVLEELEEDSPRNGFTLGIVDDVTHLSLALDPDFDIEPDDETRAVFFGLGSDGTVSANKNTIKILGEGTDQHAQAYFVYDSKKSGATTISHLRFGPRPIRASYLIRQAGLVACHQVQFLEQFDMLSYAAPGGIFLLNSPYGPDEVWDHLPREVQSDLIEKGLELHVIDAYGVAREAGLGGRINTIMQTCFFAISGVLPAEDAETRIKDAIQATYGRRGPVVVKQNFAAVDRTLANLHRVELPDAVTASQGRPPVVPAEAPELVQKVTALMMANRGDLLPVSAFPPDGTWPTGTTRWEKRAIAYEVPIWDPEICIQCNQCVFVCPHAAIRAKVFDPEKLSEAPDGFLSSNFRGKDFKGSKYTIQVAPDDCTGCHLCVEVCPAKDRTNPRHKAIDMMPVEPVRERERRNYDFLLGLPAADRLKISRVDAKGSQFLEPMFEYSGACAGCGETPYVKLLTQLFGDRLLIANATGCSSIYGGNLPTTPYTTNDQGRGPAWSNSLFEDNAEFGLGFRLALDSHQRLAESLLRGVAPRLEETLVRELLEADQSFEAGINAQRERVVELRRRLREQPDAATRALDSVADYLVEKSVWLVGGDGWAYDIGYGGLDHVMSLGRNVNVLVLDTEVYSNTGGQQSKATPLGAAAKFATAGKEIGKKDLGMEIMSYGRVYVARVAFGAKINQTVKAFREADSYDGPSLIIAYSHCIAHGYDMRHGAKQQELAVSSGIWPLYRFDPRRIEDGQPPLKLDYREPATEGVRQYMHNEARFRMVERRNPRRYRRFIHQNKEAAERRYSVYQQLAGLHIPGSTEEAPDGASEPDSQGGS